jgi:hypothetical protein
MQMPCQWSDTVPCPFSAPSDRFVEFDGREYCPLHLPLGSPEKQNATAFAERFQKLQENGNTEFAGVTFPGAVAANIARYDARCPLNLRHCTFGNRSEVVAYGVDIDLSGSSSVGTFGINIGLGPCNAVCENITCQGNVVVEATDQPNALNLRGSRFMASSRFNLVERMQFLRFDDCTFARAPSFGRSDKIPQRTTFRGARFALRAEDEGAFRTIRNYFNAQRARDAEGLFYALEKRCHRLGMTRPREWTPRAISYLYDLTSEYGYSYGWALLWFCIVHVAFGFTYAALSGRLSNLHGDFDSRVVAFTFAQIVKPFEPFSSKASSASAYAIVPNAPSGWWLLLQHYKACCRLP